jgi:ABC-type sugar transport system ATPase subunit
MGRAIVRSPQVFLMDEPLSNLDAKLRVQTRSQIAALQRRLGVTTVYVTHDQIEAMTMGDRVAVLKDGVLQQVDTPRNMYDNPNNVFVAGFIGSPAMNLLKVDAEGGTLHFGGATMAIPRETAEVADKAGRKITVGVRPEDMDIVGENEGLPTVINLVEELGADAYVYGTAEVDGKPYDIIARVDGRKPPERRAADRAPCPQGPAAACRTQRPRTARPAVGHAAGGLAGRPAGSPATRPVPARRSVRPDRRGRVRREGDRRERGPARVRPAAPAGAA